MEVAEAVKSFFRVNKKAPVVTQDQKVHILNRVSNVGTPVSTTAISSERTAPPVTPEKTITSDLEINPVSLNPNKSEIIQLQDKLATLKNWNKTSANSSQDAAEIAKLEAQIDNLRKTS